MPLETIFITEHQLQSLNKIGQSWGKKSQLFMRLLFICCRTRTYRMKKHGKSLNQSLPLAKKFNVIISQ